MALICLSLMVNDVEHFIVCLFAICISPLVKYLLVFFAHFLTELYC